MNKRDPRIDPRKGDVVRKGYLPTRHVNGFDADDNVCYSPFANGIQFCSRACSLTAWRSWAKGAEVVRRGEDA